MLCGLLQKQEHSSDQLGINAPSFVRAPAHPRNSQAAQRQVLGVLDQEEESVKRTQHPFPEGKHQFSHCTDLPAMGKCWGAVQQQP